MSAEAVELPQGIRRPRGAGGDTTIATSSYDERRERRPRLSTEQRERDYLLDRLHSLRVVVPVFAEELANARRQSAALRVENRRLLERIRQLQHERAVVHGSITVG